MPDYIDPELEDALTEFFDSWRSRVRARLVMGEERYKGSWRQMTSNELMAELLNEVLDMIAYAVMFRRREGEP